MNILVVDDDPNISEVICFALKNANYKCRIATNGIEALDMTSTHKFDLIVLDIGLPEMDGLEVCRVLRKASDIPILFLSARDEEIDRVLGLEMGGDDYVTKPFSPRELIARVKVILKRTAKSDADDNNDQSQIRHGLLVIDTGRREVTFDRNLLDFTTREFAFLLAFCRRPGMVFTRDQLMDAAYNQAIHVSDRTIDSHIRNIRAKLSNAHCFNGIETVHGFGFRMGKCDRGDKSDQ